MKPVPRAIQDRLKEKFGLHNFETWIKPLQVTEAKDGAVTIEVPSTLFRDWLNDNYLDALQAEFSHHHDEPVSITISVNPATGSDDEPPRPAPNRGNPNRRP